MINPVYFIGMSFKVIGMSVNAIGMLFNTIGGMSINQ